MDTFIVCADKSEGADMMIKPKPYSSHVGKLAVATTEPTKMTQFQGQQSSWLEAIPPHPFATRHLVGLRYKGCPHPMQHPFMPDAQYLPQYQKVSPVLLLRTQPLQ
jgi:hypothetical protein